MIINTKTCLNLCEIINFSFIEKIIDNVKNNYTIERIYIGSYFCSSFFLNSNYDNIFKIINNNFINPKITLVIPVFTEKYLIKGKDKIDELANSKEIDEITVNDYGMLEYINEKYNIKINMGRIFFKDYRDPRYEEYFNRDWTPKYNTSYLNIINRLSDCKIVGLHKFYLVCNNIILLLRSMNLVISSGDNCL